jgi:hypothetical protein
MMALGDPVGTGLATSLARPGGNVTGTTLLASGLSAKRLGLLKEIVPRLSRVGVKLLVRDIRTADDLPAAFDTGARGGAEGVLTTAESIFVVQRNRVVQLAAQHKLPALYPYRAVVDAGGPDGV